MKFTRSCLREMLLPSGHRFFCACTPLSSLVGGGGAIIKKPHKKAPLLTYHTWEIESHATHIVTLKWIEVKPHSLWQQQQQYEHDMMLRNIYMMTTSSCCCWFSFFFFAFFQKVSWNWNLSNRERRNCHIWRKHQNINKWKHNRKNYR